MCGRRRARRWCPALGKQICAVCCGTKRLVEISCPSDCVYLASAREHPPAVAVRQQQHDVAQVIHVMRDFNERQTQLFFLIGTFLLQYRSPELHAVVDEDVAEAAAALAATFETATRGVIYDHHPASRPAERLAGALKPVLAEAGKNGGTPFERDVAVVLRRFEEGARSARAADASTRAFLDLLGRVIRKPDQVEPPAAEAPRLIIP